MTKKELKLAGAISYKCEGKKLRRDERFRNTWSYRIEFCNSDPILIKIFLEFLRRIIKIEEDRLHPSVHMYDDLDRKRVMRFWSSLTEIPLDRFYRTKIYHAKNTKYKPNPLGTCRLQYHDKKAFMKLDKIIRENLGEEAALIKQI